MSRNGLRPFLKLVFLLSGLCALFAPLRSNAAFYVETGFGVGELRGIDKMYNSTAGSTGLGLASNLSLAATIGNPNSLVQLHLGLQQRLTQGGASGTSYSLMTTEPLIRLETPRFYVGFGATPLVWTQKGSSLGTSFSPAKGAMAAYAEFGLLWRVVPFFNLALAGSLEGVSKSGVNSPFPVAQATFQMRFFFGEGNKGGGHRKYDGWRYPFGVELF